MMQAFGAFAKQLLGSGGFRNSEFPKKAYRELLTGLAGMQGGAVVILPGMGRFPLGFALRNKGTDSPAELALQGMSLLRNRYELRPEAVLSDGAFSTDNTLKRLTDYGWVFVMLP
jgi:hypothetical protein